MLIIELSFFGRRDAVGMGLKCLMCRCKFSFSLAEFVAEVDCVKEWCSSVVCFSVIRLVMVYL